MLLLRATIPGTHAIWEFRHEGRVEEGEQGVASYWFRVAGFCWRLLLLLNACIRYPPLGERAMSAVPNQWKLVLSNAPIQFHFTNNPIQQTPTTQPQFREIAPSSIASQLAGCKATKSKNTHIPKTLHQPTQSLAHAFQNLHPRVLRRFIVLLKPPASLPLVGFPCSFEVFSNELPSFFFLLRAACLHTCTTVPTLRSPNNHHRHHRHHHPSSHCCYFLQATVAMQASIPCRQRAGEACCVL